MKTALMNTVKNVSPQNLRQTNSGTDDEQPAQPSQSAARIAGLVMLLTLVAGAASIAWSLATGRIDLNASTWSLKGVLSGESALHLADEIADTPLPTALADAERAASWLITGSLGPRVRRGCKNWLFLTDELSVYPYATQNAARRLETVIRVRDLLKANGTELVVATVPDKSRVQQAQLCTVYRPPSSADRLARWEQALTDAGVHHTSLLEGLTAINEASDKRNGQTSNEQAFLETDTHWTQTGAHGSAQAIASTVDLLNMDLTPRQSYALSLGKRQPRDGDLVRLAGIDWLPLSLRPKPDVVEPIEIHPVQTLNSLTESDVGDGTSDTNDTALDLFGDTNLPSAALIGTSFSRTSSFVPFLEMALQTPVPSFAMDGGDFWGSAQKYLSSNEYRQAPPKVVFWEIPERVLQMPISAHEQSWMDNLPTR